jgi:hypothetical protein
MFFPMKKQRIYWIVFMCMSHLIPVLGADTLPVHLSRIGSRFTIVPEIHNNRIRIFPLGFMLPEFTGLSITVDTDHHLNVFSGTRDDSLPDPAVQLSPTSATFSMSIPGINAELRYEILSPFTPDIPTWRIAPVMLIKVTLINRDTVPAQYTVSIAGLHDMAHDTVLHPDIAAIAAPVSFSISQAALIQQDIKQHLAPHLTTQKWKNPSFHDFSSDIRGVFMAGGRRGDGWTADTVSHSGRISVSLQAGPGCTTETYAAFLFHTSSPVLRVDGHACPFAYLDDFPDPAVMLAGTLENRLILEKSDTVFRSSLMPPTSSEEFRILAHTALQSFLACTWVVRLPDGSARYSEWEGYPLFHSTMDVVFNTSLFHLAYTPDFLGDMLKNWPRYAIVGDMPHDMGKGLVIHQNAYPVQMQMEENSNYLLLHSMYATRTHDMSLASGLKDVIGTVIRRLISSDIDGNGLPDFGVINTFDDAPASINMSENQVYLGIKKAAALQAVSSVFAGILPDSTCEQARDRAELIYTRIIESWTGTHFPIALPPPDKTPSPGKTVTQVLLPHDHSHPITTIEPLDDRIDGFSNYAAHGLVALWLCGLKAPAKLETLMKTHIETAHEKTATGFGDAHRDGLQNVWVSQNMWRDLAALYLGAELNHADLHRKYLRVQINAVGLRDGTGRWEGFCDSPYNSFLTAYSRGIPILGFTWISRGQVCLPGIQIHE